MSSKGSRMACVEGVAMKAGPVIDAVFGIITYLVAILFFVTATNWGYDAIGFVYIAIGTVLLRRAYRARATQPFRESS